MDAESGFRLSMFLWLWRKEGESCGPMQLLQEADVAGMCSDFSSIFTPVRAAGNPPSLPQVT